MLKKYFIFLFVVIIEIIIQLDISYTQPYIYYSKVKDGSPTNADIYRIDIQSGDSVLFMPNMGSISTLVWNGDQTLLFVRSRSHLYVFELNNKNKRHHLTNDIFNNLCIFDAEKINKVFITYESRGGEEVKTVVINRTTCEVSDTIKMFSPIDNLCFSDDEKTIYRSVSDSTGFIFESIDAISYSIIQDRKRCGTLGSFAFVPGIDDAKKDKVLLSYEVIPGFLYQKYVLCNPDLGITYQPISFPMRSRGYLTYNTKYVILEQVNWDATLVNLEYRPGNVCVFDAISGQLITQLSLPPEGKILFFKNYPDIIFYYLPNERRSIKIDISELANIKVFNPTFAYAGSAAFILTINGKNFTSGSIVNWNGVAKATTYMSDSVLHANILASDIAVLDSPLVTVKSADGLTESNGMRFYVKQQPVISGCIVKLVSSTGIKLTGGTLQYYDGSWKDAVNNNDGTFFINTTKTSLSLRMTYEYGTQTKSNVSISSDTVVFQTVNAKVQLQNSNGITMDTGSVQYYAGAWRVFGTTVNGTASKELLPNNYSFRMTYAYASNDKKQDLNTNPTVIFQTVNTTVQLQNSQGNLIDEGLVKYYSGAWREFGTTVNGTASKELLPNNYSFRMTYEYASNDKKQDLNTNPTVVFQTVNAAVQLQNSQGTLIDQGTVQYYSGAWRT
ncbi:MAG: hypothetical protein JXA06_00175, partial [Bacteroidetes bacterium]|nr:hypothetical protein [Bacteroidota bacterium]